MTDVNQTRRAFVLELHGLEVGLLQADGNVNSFELLDEYLESPRRPILGLVFEDEPRGRWRQAQRLPPWFANLLPEDPMRSIVARAYGISPRGEFKLFAALSEDLPGALTARAVDPIAALEGVRTEIAEEAEIGQPDSSVIKFSVAGVQPKLSMLLQSGNSFVVPGRGRLGDFLVKLPSTAFRGVPENEYATMWLASQVGITVPDVSLFPLEEVLPSVPAGYPNLVGSHAYAIRRFDREPLLGEMHRIHMEDFAQILGSWPEEKYQGATYDTLAVIIREVCGDEDLVEFIRRLAFCALVGNEDAHLKNWSLYYLDGVTPRLTPAYDLVSTIQYDELDRGFALRLGRGRDFRHFKPSGFRRLGERLGVGELGVEVYLDVFARARNVVGDLADFAGIDKAFVQRLQDHSRLNLGVPL